MALKLDILANTRQMVSEMTKAGASIEDISDALEEVAREGRSSGEKLERSFKDLVREAKKAEKATADVGDRGFKKAGESTGAFKDEAISNFSEVASSFSGDVTQMAEGVQGLTGGLASALTPGIGIPIAILGAAAGAFLNSWITASEESSQRVDDMFERMKEAGTQFASEEQLTAAIQDLDTTQVEEGLKRARDLALDQGAVLRAMVGDMEAIEALQKEINGRKQEELDAVRNSGASLEDQKTKLDAIETAYGEQVEWLNQIQSDTQKAGDKWAAVRDAIRWAGGDVSDLEGRLKGLATGTYAPVIKPVLDYSAINAAEAWAKRGLNVAVTGTLQGRPWV